jgi:hypothetical protein
MVIGVTINAAIIGNVANIVANLESDQHDFATRVDEVKRYMFKVSQLYCQLQYFWQC